jgi:hypothetical protein
MSIPQRSNRILLGYYHVHVKFSTILFPLARGLQLTRIVVIFVVLPIGRRRLSRIASFIFTRYEDLFTYSAHPRCLFDLQKLWKEVWRQAVGRAFATN